MHRTRPVTHLLVGFLALAFVAGEARANGSGAGEPAWQSAQAVSSVSSPGSVEFYRATVTGAGVPVVVGAFGTTATFPTGPAQDDSISLTAASGSRDLIVGGMNAGATLFTWVTQVKNSGGILSASSVISLGQTTATTTDDTILLVGSASQRVYFPSGPGADDSIAFVPVGTWGSFIATIPPDEWEFASVLGLNATSTSQPEIMQIHSAMVRPSGDVIVTGIFSDTLTLPTTSGSLTLTSLPDRESGFIAQMNPDDYTFDWAQKIGAVNNFTIVANTSATVSGDGRLYVAGQFLEAVTFPTGPASDDSLLVTGPRMTPTGFVAQMNVDDTYFAWVQPISGAAGFQIRPIMSPDTGGPLVVGQLDGDRSFPTGPGDDSVVLISSGLEDIFVARLNSDDSYFAWAIGGGGTGSDFVSGSQLTEDGTLLIAGGFGETISLPTHGEPIEMTAATGGIDLLVAGLSIADEAFAWAEQGGVAPGDYAESYAVTSLNDGRPLVLGYLYGSMTLPGIQPPLTLTGQFNGSGVLGVLAVPPVAPADPSTPASPPSGAAAVAGSASAVVSWSAPASSGSYPVTYYLATSSPGGRTCLTSSLSCTVAGLTNGTAYTFTVQALTGAGWSPASSPSEAVTPVAPARPTITITGAREGKRIVVSGSTTGMGMGGLVTPWTSKAGAIYVPARDLPVSVDGTFSWSRRAKPQATWQVYFTADGARSNTITIR